jgi:cyanophycinase
MSSERSRRADVPRWLVAVALSMALATRVAAQSSGQPRVGPPKGSLMAVGGAMQSAEIYDRFIRLAGGRDARIVLIPTAGGEAFYDNSFIGVEAFRQHGARNLVVLHTIHRDVADTDDFVEPLKTAGGVFIFGGRQFLLADAYGGTKTEEQIRKVMDRGGVVAGTSAGASILASFLIPGDTETNAMVMGDHQRGFGFLRGVAIDQHLLRRNRQFDMLDVIEAHPDLLGIGLDEDTAIEVHGDRFEVLGASYAIIYDNGATTGKDGRFFFLAPGDGYDMAARRARRPSREETPVPNVRSEPWGGN